MLSREGGQEVGKTGLCCPGCLLRAGPGGARALKGGGPGPTTYSAPPDWGSTSVPSLGQAQSSHLDNGGREAPVGAQGIKPRPRRGSEPGPLAPWNQASCKAQPGLSSATLARSSLGPSALRVQEGHRRAHAHHRPRDSDPSRPLLPHPPACPSCKAGLRTGGLTSVCP